MEPPPQQFEVFLGQVVQLVCNSSMAELRSLAQNLPTETDLKRREQLIRHFNDTRHKFLKLLVLVQWAATNLQILSDETRVARVMEQRAAVIHESMSALQRGTFILHTARAPLYDVSTAVDIQFSGTYLRLPQYIQNLAEQDQYHYFEGISEAETYRKLDRLILNRLMSTTIPPQFTSILVKNGKLICEVKHEFSVVLRLMNSSSDSPWRVLSIKLHVSGDPAVAGFLGDIPEAKLDTINRASEAPDQQASSAAFSEDKMQLVKQYQVNYLLHLVQQRVLNSEAPIVDVYALVHMFCASVCVEILSLQARHLADGLWKGKLRVQDSKSASKLLLAHWISEDNKHVGGTLSIDSATPVERQVSLDVHVEPAPPHITASRSRFWELVTRRPQRRVTTCLTLGEDTLSESADASAKPEDVSPEATLDDTTERLAMGLCPSMLNVEFLVTHALRLQACRLLEELHRVISTTLGLRECDHDDTIQLLLDGVASKLEPPELAFRRGVSSGQGVSGPSGQNMSRSSGQNVSAAASLSEGDHMDVDSGADATIVDEPQTATSGTQPVRRQPCLQFRLPGFQFLVVEVDLLTGNFVFSVSDNVSVGFGGAAAESDQSFVRRRWGRCRQQDFFASTEKAVRVEKSRSPDHYMAAVATIVLGAWADLKARVTLEFAELVCETLSISTQRVVPGAVLSGTDPVHGSSTESKGAMLPPPARRGGDAVQDMKNARGTPTQRRVYSRLCSMGEVAYFLEIGCHVDSIAELQKQLSGRGRRISEEFGTSYEISLKNMLRSMHFALMWIGPGMVDVDPTRQGDKPKHPHLPLDWGFPRSGATLEAAFSMGSRRLAKRQKLSDAPQEPMNVHLASGMSMILTQVVSEATNCAERVHLNRCKTKLEAVGFVMRPPVPDALAYFHDTIMANDLAAVSLNVAFGPDPELFYQMCALQGISLPGKVLSDTVSKQIKELVFPCVLHASTRGVTVTVNRVALPSEELEKQRNVFTPRPRVTPFDDFLPISGNLAYRDGGAVVVVFEYVNPIAGERANLPSEVAPDSKYKAWADVSSSKQQAAAVVHGAIVGASTGRGNAHNGKTAEHETSQARALSKTAGSTARKLNGKSTHGGKLTGANHHHANQRAGSTRQGKPTTGKGGAVMAGQDTEVGFATRLSVDMKKAATMALLGGLVERFCGEAGGSLGGEAGDNPGGNLDGEPCASTVDIHSLTHECAVLVFTPKSASGAQPIQIAIAVNSQARFVFVSSAPLKPYEKILATFLNTRVHTEACFDDVRQAVKEFLVTLGNLLAGVSVLRQVSMIVPGVFAQSNGFKDGVKPPASKKGKGLGGKLGLSAQIEAQKAASEKEAAGIKLIPLSLTNTRLLVGEECWVDLRFDVDHVKLIDRAADKRWDKAMENVNAKLGLAMPPNGKATEIPHDKLEGTLRTLFGSILQ